MKVGLIARADNAGLGAQTWEAYRNLCPDKTVVIDLTELTGMRTYHRRFPDAVVVPHAAWQQSVQHAYDFMEDLDVVFTAETAYRDDFYDLARFKGVKTVLHANFEFLPWFTNPALPTPDAMWMSSMWRYDDVPDSKWGKKSYMPTPVDRLRCAFLQRKHCFRFLHIVGRKTDMDRNGTRTVMESGQYRQTGLLTKPPYDDVVYTQARTVRHELVPTPGFLTMEHEPDNYWNVYADCDNGQLGALVAPRRYAGQSLQMQEALSCGMPVISLDIDPNSRLLPKEWLIPARKLGTLSCQSGLVEVWGGEPHVLAAKMDEFASANDFTEYSAHANDIAKTLDWDVWQQPYLDALRDVAFGR